MSTVDRKGERERETERVCKWNKLKKGRFKPNNSAKKPQGIHFNFNLISKFISFSMHKLL